MRILHIFDHSIPLHSGYSFRSLAILRQQRAHGWRTFHLTSPKQGPVERPCETIEGLEFYRTPAHPGALARLPGLGEATLVRATARRIVEVAREVKPDILHAHSPVLNGLAAASAARRLGLPLVYEIRAFWEDAAAAHGTCRNGGPRYHLTKLAETRVMRRAQAITTICAGLKADIMSRGLAAEKVTVIPNGVDLDKFSSLGTRDEGLRATLGLSGATILGFAGSFYGYEGIDLLVEAMAQVIRKNRQIKLLLVGGGPEKHALEGLAQRLGLGESIVFTGRIPHDDIQKYYSLVDIFVYPRRSMRLTELVTPLKPLEAMAYGKPVLASDVGGHREMIADGKTGRLFKADDAADLAGAILDMTTHRDNWPAQIDAAKAYVAAERAWPAIVARYEEVYRRLTGTGAAPAALEDALEQV
jgi:PEP-CTERM/exosortase A-associated glycosyltransferase